jgi:hypothetical protein
MCQKKNQVLSDTQGTSSSAYGIMWLNAVANAIGYAQHCSRSDNAVIRVYDDAGNVIETDERNGGFKEAVRLGRRLCLEYYGSPRACYVPTNVASGNENKIKL